MFKQTNQNNVLHWNNIAVSVYLLIIIFYFESFIYKLGKFESLWLIASLALIQFLISKVNQFYQGKQQTKKSLKELPKSILVVLASVMVSHCVAILFGAPFFDNFEGTLMFALLITTLTTLPNCLYLGPDNTINMLLSLTSSYDEHLIQMTVLRITIFGAWAGAAVVPLDWGKSWQQWPIPSSVGTIIGFIVGSSISQLHHSILKKSRKILL